MHHVSGYIGLYPGRVGEYWRRECGGEEKREGPGEDQRGETEGRVGEDGDQNGVQVRAKRRVEE